MTPTDPSDGRLRLSRAVPSTLPVLVITNGEDSASLAEHVRVQRQKCATQMEPKRTLLGTKAYMDSACEQFPTLAFNLVQSRRSLASHPDCFLVMWRWL